MRGKEQRAPKRLERAAVPQREREPGALRDAQARQEKVPEALLQPASPGASPEAAWVRRPGVRVRPVETAVGP